MEKRFLIIGLLIVFMMLFTVAQEAPDTGVGAEDVEKIQEAIDTIPIDESGEFMIDHKRLKKLIDIFLNNL